MTPRIEGPEQPEYSPFAHLTVPNAALYRQVMRTFLAAKERFAVHLRPEDVHTAMEPGQRPADVETVTKALDSLVDWGNLRADPDTARVTAVEDFYRKRFIYQLTRAGEAAEAALGTYDETLGRRGALQAVALHDIVTQLRALLVVAADDQPDPAKTHLALDALASRFTALADNARAFMGSLQRTIDLHEVEEEVFLAYKDRLIQYLERFIQDLITLGGRIAQLILSLETDGRIDVLLRAAAAREAADATPEEAGHAEQEAYLRWAGRWDGLAAWFISRDGRESQARLLRGRALGAIPQMLAVVRSLGAPGRALRPVRRLPHTGPLVRRSPRRRLPAPAVAYRLRALPRTAPHHRRRHSRRTRRPSGSRRHTLGLGRAAADQSPAASHRQL